MLDDPLRGGDLLGKNDCITTVPEWMEGGHVRGGGLREEDTVRECLKNMSVWDRHIPYDS